MSLRAKREENFWILHGEFFWILQTKKTVKRKRNGKGNFEILLHAKRGNNFKMSPCAKREENFGILQMKRTIKKKRIGENNISRFYFARSAEKIFRFLMFFVVFSLSSTRSFFY